MERSGGVISVLERPAIYALWQAPFARQKLGPVLKSDSYRSSNRILDIGCGPGTNAPFFKGRDYLGIDLNPLYIESARARHKMAFETADASTWRPPDGRTWDLVLINSLLHHLDDEQVERVLATARSLLAARGEVQILDLVLPPSSSIARTMARLDRGQHPRPLQQWTSIFQKYFNQLESYQYPLGLAGLTLWQMVYYRGTARA